MNESYYFGCDVTSRSNFTTEDLLRAYCDFRKLTEIVESDSDYKYLKEKRSWSEPNIPWFRTLNNGDKIKFCVISNPRSGSNHLCALLNSHPEIICQFELFHPDEVFAIDGYSFTVEERDKDPIKFLENLAEDGLKAHKAFGFKILPTVNFRHQRNREVLDYVLQSYEWKIIVLDRHNKLLQHASHLRAELTDQYYSRGGKYSKVVKVHFDSEKFMQDYQSQINEMEYVRKHVEEKGYIFISYEDLVTRGIDHILHAMGLRIDVDLYSPLKKQGSNLVSESFENYEDVIAYITECMPDKIWWLDQSPISPSLLVTEKRDRNSYFNAWNFIERNGLQNDVKFIPYYRGNPIKNFRKCCNVWIKKSTPKSSLSEDILKKAYEEGIHGNLSIDDGKDHILFFTMFHPFQIHGYSTYIQMWLQKLKERGATTHLVYYDIHPEYVSIDQKNTVHQLYEYYHEVPVESKLTGKNYNGLNIHVDDWVGVELIECIEGLIDTYDYSQCWINYPTYTALFDLFPETTKKILLTIDRYANRNTRMIEAGFKGSGWMSITTEGERVACERADVVVAIQEDEKDYFAELLNDASKIEVVPQIFEKRYLSQKTKSNKLCVGYFGAHNYVNEQSIGKFLSALKVTPDLKERCTIILAGEVSDHLEEIMGEDVADGIDLKLIGRVEDLAAFFGQCDVIVNPEIGGSGLKIKTVEALSYGMPLISTVAGMAGISSKNKFHNASDHTELVKYMLDLLNDPSKIKDLKRSSEEVYDAFYEKYQRNIDNLLDSLTIEETKILHPESFKSFPDTSLSVEETDKSSPLVSIVIPYFNVADYIDDCLTSVTNQTYKNLEIILVDDASQDRSREIVLDYLAVDSRLKLITHDKNKGLGPARNTGVKHASGDYLFFLDSDDLLIRSAILNLVDTIQSKDVDIVVGSCNRINENLVVDDYTHSKADENDYGFVSGLDAFMRATEIDRDHYLPLRAWGILFSMDFYRRGGWEFPPGEHEDMGLIPFAYYSAGKIFFSKDVVVTYRWREASISISKWTKNRFSNYQSLWRIIREKAVEHGLDQYIGDLALTHLMHVFFRVEENGYDADSQSELQKLVQELSSHISTANQNINLAPKILVLLRRLFFSDELNENVFREYTRGFNIDVLQRMYQ